MRSGQKVAHANIAGGLGRGRAAGRKSAPRKSRDAVVINAAGGSRKVAAATIAIKQGGSTSRGDGRDLLSRGDGREYVGGVQAPARVRVDPLSRKGRGAFRATAAVEKLPPRNY